MSLASIYNAVTDTYEFSKIQLTTEQTTITDVGTLEQVINYHSDEIYDARSSPYISTGMTPGSSIFFNPDFVTNELEMEVQYLKRVLSPENPTILGLTIPDTLEKQISLYADMVDSKSPITVEQRLAELKERYYRWSEEANSPHEKQYYSQLANLASKKTPTILSICRVIEQLAGI